MRWISCTRMCPGAADPLHWAKHGLLILLPTDAVGQQVMHSRAWWAWSCTPLEFHTGSDPSSLGSAFPAFPIYQEGSHGSREHVSNWGKSGFLTYSEGLLGSLGPSLLSEDSWLISLLRHTPQIIGVLLSKQLRCFWGLRGPILCTLRISSQDCTPRAAWAILGCQHSCTIKQAHHLLSSSTRYHLAGTNFEFLQHDKGLWVSACFAFVLP